MRGTFEEAHQFTEGDIALDRDDIGAMNHDVGDATLMQPEDIAQHRAFNGGEPRIIRRRSIEHDLEIIAD